MKHCTADCHVCPSAVAATIAVPTHNLPDAHLVAHPEEAPRWSLTIYEALAIALDNSEVVRSSGLIAAQSSNTDRIRAEATAYDQMIAAQQRNGSWGIFDPVLTTEMKWKRTDIPPGTSFSGIGNRPSQLDEADFDASIEQLMPVGTRWHIDYSTDYLFNPARPVSLNPNPQHFSILQFGLQQPLLQGLGVDVNLAPIRISTARAEQSGWEFKREMLALVRSVETAYWDLYALQRDLEVIRETIPLFGEIVRVRESQLRSNAGTDTEVARAEVDLLRYEQMQMDILSRIEEQQLVIRNLLGLDPSDGRYLEVMAVPQMVLPHEQPNEAVLAALDQRPDILRQRLAVYVACQEKIVARDTLRPKLDGFGVWRMNGLDDNVGGSLDQLFEDDYRDWELGVRLEVPLGRRQGWANVRASDMEIRRQRALLDQAAHQASFEVADAYRRIYWLHREHDVALRRVSALKRWQSGAKAVFENPPPGTDLTDALESYADTLRGYIEASEKQHVVLANFNSALARLEEVKGTLLSRRDIEVMGDPTDQIREEVDLPSIAQPEGVEAAPNGMPEPGTNPPAEEPKQLPAPNENPSPPTSQYQAPAPTESPLDLPAPGEHKPPAPLHSFQPEIPQPPEAEAESAIEFKVSNAPLTPTDAGPTPPLLDAAPSQPRYVAELPGADDSDARPLVKLHSEAIEPAPVELPAQEFASAPPAAAPPVKPDNKQPAPIEPTLPLQQPRLLTEQGKGSPPVVNLLAPKPHREKVMESPAPHASPTPSPSPVSSLPVPKKLVAPPVGMSSDSEGIPSLDQPGSVIVGPGPSSPPLAELHQPPTQSVDPTKTVTRPAAPVEPVPNMISIDSVITPSLDQPGSVSQVEPAQPDLTEPAPLPFVLLQPLPELLLPASLSPSREMPEVSGLALPGSLTTAPGLIPLSSNPSPQPLFPIEQPSSVQVGQAHLHTSDESLEMPSGIAPSTRHEPQFIPDELVNPALFQPIR